MSRESIRDRFAASTPGEWEWAGPIEDIGAYLAGIQERTDAREDRQPVAWTVQTPDPEEEGASITPAFCGNGPRAAHNAEFVALAHQDIPALLAVADAASVACVSGKPEDIRRLSKALAALEALP